MPSVLPQVRVQQEFTQSPVSAEHPLHAHITAPHAFLVRFAEEDERETGLLGFYDRLIDTTYSWPGLPTGAKVDLNYTKVFIKNALLQYFDDQVSAGSTITRTARNKVRSATVNFKENGDAYPRNALLLDRDVRVGDIVKVRGTPDVGDPITLWTSVRDFEGDTVAAVISAATPDDDNPATQSASATTEQTAGVENCVRLDASAAGYDGLPSGFIDETYTVVVTESSTGADHTTAKIRLISASGEDDEDDITPAAEGNPTTVGARGLTVTFRTSDGTSCSEDAEEAEVGIDDLIAGQTWEVTVQDAFTKPVATAAGTYTGDWDTTYVIEVTRGGLYASATDPQITVTTTTGVDISGPTTVTAAATAVAVGTEGVTVSFSGLGLRKGDKYYIEVTAAAEGPLRTLVLANDISDDIEDGTEVSLTLYILVPELEVEQNREGFAPLTNWDATASELTVHDSIIAYESSWTDDGELVALDVHSEESQEYGQLYVEYRAWRQELCGQFLSISDTADIGDISGDLHPDNPLKWAVFKALQNSGGTEVHYSAVCDPDDSDSWAAVLSLLQGRSDVYGLVPITRDPVVLGLYQAHCDTMSDADQNLWRVLWVSLQGMPEIPMVSAANALDSNGEVVPGHTVATTSDEEEALATITDDPDTAGTQYTLVRCTSENGQFVTNGVRTGDILRALFTTDGFGGTVYSEFEIATVVNEDSLLLDSGPAAAVNVGAKIEIWRNLTASEEAEEVANRAAAWGNKRVRAVWPDTIESDGTTQEGYHLCAALAGLASGVLPHQGLTRVQIQGFSDVSRTIDHFSRTDLDLMAGLGVFIVTEDLFTGQIYARQAITTDDYDNLNVREEMIIRNVDSISYRIAEVLDPFIGKTNVVNSNRDKIEVALRSVFEVLKSESFTEELGGQLVEAIIVDIRVHATQLDRFVVDLDITVPAPLNNIDVRLII